MFRGRGGKKLRNIKTGASGYYDFRYFFFTWTIIGHDV